MRYMQGGEVVRILQLIATNQYVTQRIHDEPEDVIDELCSVIQCLLARIERLEMQVNPEGYL